MKRMIAGVVVGSSLGLLAVASGAIAQDAGNPVVQVQNGTVAGTREGDVDAFKGIPFAAPPVGSLRWRAPQPVASWSGVRSAEAFAPDCIAGPESNAWIAPRGAQSEDCLYLNVWKPRAAKRPLPVMVWIYGGGFTNGGTTPAIYDGASLAKQGVILVSVNYRVGQLGFFAHPALAAEQAGEARWPGVVRNGKVARLADLLPDAPGDLGTVFAQWQVWDPRIEAAVSGASDAEWQNEADLVAHLPYKPEDLYGAGANYRQHVIELIVDSGAGGVEHLSREERHAHGVAEMDRRAASGKPFVWVALRSSVAGPARTLVLPHDVTQPDWELELAVVIGKAARRVSVDDALGHVAGYTIANDVTARELVSRSDLKNLGMDWMASKGSPGFKIIGPYITPARFVPDPQALTIRLSLNGQVMQDGGTDDMIFGVAKIVSFVSMHTQLQPGDIIMTGSPSGNGTHYGRFLRDGDEMLGEIDGLLGAQRVRCAAETPIVAAHPAKAEA